MKQCHLLRDSRADVERSIRECGFALRSSTRELPSALQQGSTLAAAAVGRVPLTNGIRSLPPLDPSTLQG